MQMQVLKTIGNFHLLVKPTGASCNQSCDYCFYHRKERLYPGSRFRMSEELQNLYIKQLLEAQPTGEVALSWQGGEPTLMGLAFFRQAVHCAETLKKPGQRLIYTLQTNGTLLDEAWCQFLKAHHFLVGLSLDGPREIHDAYRVDRKGNGTFNQVLQGWDLLKKYEVDVNIMCAVHAANERRGLEVYRFLRDTLGATFIQFIPIVGLAGSAVPRCPGETEAPAGASLQDQTLGAKSFSDGLSIGEKMASGSAAFADYSVRGAQFGRFLIDIFNEWWGRDNGSVFVQAFDVALGNWIGQPTLCAHAATCGRALVLEHNGDLYSCDHFVDQQHLLGNILNTPMGELAALDHQVKFGANKLKLLPQYCRKCEVFSLCYGGCPKDRLIRTSEGEPGLNYLCPGYQAFFRHIIPALKEMARFL